MARKIVKPDPREGLWLRGSTYWFVSKSKPGVKRTRVSLKTDDLAEAIVKAREMRQYPGRFEAREAGALLELFIDHQQRKGLSRARQDLTRIVLGDLSKSLSHGTLETVTAAQAHSWFTGLLERVKPKSAKDYLGITRVFYKWAIDARHLTLSPVALIIPPKIRPTPRRVFLTPADALRVLDQCTDEDLKFALYCGLHAGLRRGEVIASRPRWFDLEGGVVHVQNEADWLTKDRDNRSIPLTGEFLAFLKTYGIRSPYMFRPDKEPKPTNKSWRYRTDFIKQFNSHMERLKLAHVTFHDLRRTFASLHASRGTPIFHIARWLGDDPSVVEQTYAHLLPNDLRINDPWTQARDTAEKEKAKAETEKS